GEKQYAFAA
ncbi:tmRNA tag peptide, partial [Blattabacterium punctulatus CPU2]